MRTTGECRITTHDILLSYMIVRMSDLRRNGHSPMLGRGARAPPVRFVLLSFFLVLCIYISMKLQHCPKRKRKRFESQDKLYSSRASRRLIDFLEGDTVVRAIEELGHLWYGCIVTFKVDNTAFQKSAQKGRSRVDRLNDLVREIFHLCIRFNCVILFEWISSEDNLLADHLSRDRELDFLAAVFAVGFWAVSVTVRRHRLAGDKRVLPET